MCVCVYECLCVHVLVCLCACVLVRFRSFIFQCFNPSSSRPPTNKHTNSSQVKEPFHFTSQVSLSTPPAVFLCCCYYCCCCCSNSFRLTTTLICKERYGPVCDHHTGYHCGGCARVCVELCVLCVLCAICALCCLGAVLFVCYAVLCCSMLFCVCVSCMLDRHRPYKLPVRGV
jgi:hypothetical protein